MRKFTIATLIVFSTFTSPVFSADENNTVPGLTAAGAALGMHGIDPVAFVNINNRITGTAKYTGVHNNVAYYFASKENLEMFKKSPQSYVPQNGGFCTFGVSVGKKFDGNPRFAAIEEGKLYLFLNEAIFKEFQKDRKGTIKKAASNWKKIKHVAATKL
ncbi:hypothetical protein FLL46_22230 [Aliikangiella coralliicola]|uniref:YHS domain-containing protein n=2 Tax=Aliikangiella coralliicola TaxID=2592383 RepID=A0A545U548_9GAMM|nr:hypothetical protein FLL46_22230 [Aliikangiella coralliicola]